MKNLMRSERGNTLLIVIASVAALSLMVVGFSIHSESVATTSAALMKRKRTLYVAESSRSIAINIAQNYLTTTPTPASSALLAALQDPTTGLPAAVASPFSISNIKADFLSAPVTKPIPNGPFAGMYAPQTTVTFDYDVSTTTNDEFQSVTHLHAAMSLAQIGLFEFMYFFDQPFVDFNPGGSMNVDGRVHANGNLCLNGTTGLYFNQITAAGYIMDGRTNLAAPYSCLAAATKGATPGAYIYPSVASSPAIQLTKGVAGGNYIGAGCTNCGGTGKDWLAYAPWRWGGALLDKTHGVTPIVLPVPSTVSAQAGMTNTWSTSQYSNKTNIRYVMDPVLPPCTASLTAACDTPAIQKQKFADKAHIRIIDGMWFLKDPDHPLYWPGMPIWSDHPGSYTDPFLKKLDGTALLAGQDDIRAYWAAKSIPWVSGATPHRFSYYEYDPTTKMLSPDTNGIISYGALNRAAPGLWRPGFWADNSPAFYHMADRICLGPSTFVTAPASIASGTATGPTYFDATDAITCNDGNNPSYQTKLLAAALTGFNDPHKENSSVASFWNYNGFDQQFGHQLPENFDVRQLALALQDTSAGELGSYFGGASTPMRATFNGIVFITNRYPGVPYDNDGPTPGLGSEAGYSPEGLAAGPPYVTGPSGAYPTTIAGGGSASVGTPTLYFPINDTGPAAQSYPKLNYYVNWAPGIQPTAWLSMFSQSAFPYNLCSTSAGTGSVTGYGLPYDASTPNRRYVIPNCNSYRNTATGATVRLAVYPTATRVFNGASIPPLIFPKGLSIVSNQAVYLLGDYNTTSDPSSAIATPWVPALVGGDQILVQSNNWNDSGSPWYADMTTLPNLATRQASQTTFNTAFISGWLRTVDYWASVSFHSAPALMEDWATPAAILHHNGSTVIGFNNVYYRSPITFIASPLATSPYNSYTRLVNFDKHFNYVTNMPPGTPVFYVAAVLNWKVE
jgi:hypothetical protein